MVWLISLRIIKNCQLLTRRQLEKAGGWEGWLVLFRDALADRGGLITCAFRKFMPQATFLFNARTCEEAVCRYWKVSGSTISPAKRVLKGFL